MHVGMLPVRSFRGDAHGNFVEPWIVGHEPFFAQDRCDAQFGRDVLRSDNRVGRWVPVIDPRPASYSISALRFATSVASIHPS